MECAWAWITTFAPEEFRWSLSSETTPLVEVSDNERAALKALKGFVEEKLDELSEKEFSNYLYEAASAGNLESGAFFSLVYRVLISKERGPKLAGFIKICGKDKILPILSRY